MASRTVIEGGYEWDRAKALQNQRAHGVSFAEAATALADDSGGRGRCRGVGVSRRGRTITVVFEERGKRERIISAWKATPQERRDYMRL